MHSSLSENFLQSQYPESTLPPLWEVIYQEAMRGHHLLFQRGDVERYDAIGIVRATWQDETLTDELELTVLKVIGSNELQDMVKVIDGLPDDQRASLYAFYRRALFMWQHYMKARLN